MRQNGHWNWHCSGFIIAIELWARPRCALFHIFKHLEKPSTTDFTGLRSTIWHSSGPLFWWRPWPWALPYTWTRHQNQLHLLEYFVGAYKLCKKGSWSYQPIGHSNPPTATTSQKWQLQQWKATLLVRKLIIPRPILLEFVKRGCSKGALASRQFNPSMLTNATKVVVTSTSCL